VLNENDGSGCPLLVHQINPKTGTLYFFGPPGAEEERYINIIDTAYYEHSSSSASVVRLHIGARGVWWEAQSEKHRCHWAKTGLAPWEILEEIALKG
jgi:hypothetical protein